MITKILQRRILSENLTLQILQVGVSLFAAIVTVAGILTLSDMELTKAQFILGLSVVLLLASQCCIIGMLLEIRKKAA